MAIIYSYPKKSNPQGSDVFIITDPSATSKNKNRTKSVDLDAISAYVITSQSATTGSGSAETIPVFTGPTSLGNSNITDDGIEVAVGVNFRVDGEVTLDELLSNRDEISNRIQKIIDKATDAWGLKVDKVELKHMELPENMKRIMAREAEAEREKRGLIIKSEGEIVAATNLAKAASVIAKYPGAMNLRTLQTINDIAQDPSQKFIFYPTEFSKIFK